MVIKSHASSALRIQDIHHTMADDESQVSGSTNQSQNIAFSLTPATAIGGIIDYSTNSGRKMYASATAKLEEDQFDCFAEDLYSFLKALKDRARKFGWDTYGVGILSIPDDPINPTDFKSLIDQHGEIE